MEWHRDQFIVSDDTALMDVEVISTLLASTYWAAGRSQEIIKESINNSLSFGLYHEKQQIGFARVVTDRAVFSWVMDVVIDEKYRGNGLGSWLMNCVLIHPAISHTKFALATSDAHEFYKKFNFKEQSCMTKPS